MPQSDADLCSQPSISRLANLPARPRSSALWRRWSSCPVGQHCRDLRRQSIAPGLGGFDRLDVVLDHEVMHRLLELEPREPAAMQFGSSRPPVMAALPQQEAPKLLACPAQRMHRVATGAHQFAHRLVPGIRNTHRRQLARPMQPCQAGSIPPVGLDPVARSPGDQRGGNHDAFVPDCRYLTLNAITAWPRLVAKPQAHAVAAELAQQTAQRRRRVGEPAVLPDLAAQTGRRRRDGDPFLVNLKPNVSD